MDSYLGNINDESMRQDDFSFNNDILIWASKRGDFPALLFFWKKYNTYPLSIQLSLPNDVAISNSHVKKVFAEYNHDINRDIIKYSRKNKTNYTHAMTHLSEITDGIMVYLSDGLLKENMESEIKIDYDVQKYHHVFESLRIYYLPEKEEAALKLLEKFNEYTMQLNTEATLNMISCTQCGFNLTKIKIKNPLISDLKLHYGTGFIDIHDTILTALKAENTHGLILLHGLPGILMIF